MQIKITEDKGLIPASDNCIEEIRETPDTLNDEIKHLVLPMAIGLIILTAFVLTPLFLFSNKTSSGTIAANEISINSGEIFNLTNQERENAGLNALTANELLNIAAQNKAISMYQRDYFMHTTPEGKKFYEWIEDTGYDYSIVGENLAVNFSKNESIVNLWMQSTKHKKNILNSEYAETGIAVIETGDSRKAVVVQLFGAPK